MSFPENSSSSFVASLWISNTDLLGIQQGSRLDLRSMQLNWDSDTLPQYCICKCSTLCWGCMFGYLVLSPSCCLHLVRVCCSNKQHSTVRTMSDLLTNDLLTNTEAIEIYCNSLRLSSEDDIYKFSIGFAKNIFKPVVRLLSSIENVTKNLFSLKLVSSSISKYIKAEKSLQMTFLCEQSRNQKWKWKWK